MIEKIYATLFVLNLGGAITNLTSVCIQLSTYKTRLFYLNVALVPLCIFCAFGMLEMMRNDETPKKTPLFNFWAQMDF